MQNIIWFLSLVIFSWCYSTWILCFLNIKSVPKFKLSLILYSIILVILYLISYFFISKYFNDIVGCSIIALVLSLFTTKNGINGKEG